LLDRYFISVPEEDNESAMALEDTKNNDCEKHNKYLIVRSLKGSDGKSQRGYSLSPGHVIKLGRIEYRVIEIKGQKEGSDEMEVKMVAGSTEDDSCFDADKQVYPEGTERICRYCLIEEDAHAEQLDLNNALLFPCKCSGSAGGVHF
jgi:autonomous glycyl radical cofactor GrcA